MILDLLLGNQIKKITSKLDEFLVEIEADKMRAIKLEKELEEVKIEREKYKNLVVTIGNTIPDLMWCKDLEGKYIYVNPEICRVLFYNLPIEYIIGKTDIQITKKCKSLVGNENHTFGEVCKNSDLIVLENMKKQKFLEYGKVNGTDIYLVVHKAPVFNSNNECFGTCGTGRDITEWYLGLQSAIELCGKKSCEERKDILINELNKYKFEV